MADESYSSWIGDLTFAVSAGVGSGILGLAFGVLGSLLHLLLLGFASQAVKITVDTILQHHVVDAFRGRVFALYDMLFNVALVVAALLTAAVLPEDGHSPESVILVAIAWATTAAEYLRAAAVPTTRTAP